MRKYDMSNSGMRDSEAMGSDMRDGEMRRSDMRESVRCDLELALVIADREEEAVLAGLQIRPLLAHQFCQQLLLQAGPCDCEVDQGHLDAHLRQVVGVGQGGCHVQLEGRVVLHICVSQVDY